MPVANPVDTTHPPRAGSSMGPVWPVLIAISACHMVNDILQSLLSAIYPLLKDEFALSYAQIGWMTFAFQVTASLLQPLVGVVTDRRPMPRSLAIGMLCSFVGVLTLAGAGSYGVLLTGAMLIGLGSSIFHPESSRVARIASGGRFGTAQSLFQLGGNGGQALGPLLAAFLVVPFGRPVLGWLALIALAGAITLWRVGAWADGRRKAGTLRHAPAPALGRGRILMAIGVLGVLSMTKAFYMASLTSYYTFFLIDRFGVSASTSQVMLFLLLFGSAAGVMLGGIVGDRVGSRKVIWFSILGALPFTLLLPHVGLVANGILAVLIGAIFASAAPATVVFAQELVPGRTGLIAGLFFGFAFGMGGIAAAVLGWVADARGIRYVFLLCSFLPLLGLLTAFLPRERELVPAR